MEDATETRYWCHLCSLSMIPVIDGEIILCNFCQSGFVEEMDNTQDSVTNDHHQAADSLLVGMMNNHDHHTSNRIDSDDDEDDNEQNNDGETDFDWQLEDIMRRWRNHSASVLNLHQSIRAGLSFISETNVDNPDTQLEILINSFNQRDDANSLPSGSLGDYGFEMLLQRLAENDPNNRYGTPPATKEAVETLAMVKIKERLQCTVCLDDFEIGMDAKEMPCKHKFHSDCLLPWLELHSSCPVCRYLLPAEDG